MIFDIFESPLLSYAMILIGTTNSNSFGWLLPSFALGISFWGTGGHLDSSKFKSRTWVDYLSVSVVRYPRIPTLAGIPRPFWCRYSQRENISSTLEVHRWRTSTLRIIFFPEFPWWWTQWLSFKPCVDYGAEESGWTPSWYTFTAHIAFSEGCKPYIHFRVRNAYMMQ